MFALLTLLYTHVKKWFDKKRKSPTDFSEKNS